LPEGEYIQEEVLVEAFFLKLWAYRTAAASSTAPQSDAARSKRRGIQISPLFIGGEPQRIQISPSSNARLAVVWGSLVAVSMAAMCFLVWRIGRAGSRRASAGPITLPTIPEPPLFQPESKSPTED
jgi:hypothetical protein